MNRKKGDNMDIRLHYTEKGSGEPLILLHGNGENGRYFVNQTDFFAEKYRVIAVDTRGHGQSPRGEAPFLIRQFAEDLAGFMDGLGIERANILGFSDGGNIAVTFALKYPQRVNRLILNGANIFPRGMKLHILLPIIIACRFLSLFAPVSRRAKENAELLRLMTDEPRISPQELSRLSVRTLVIAGTRDMVKDSHTRLIYRSLPEAELAILKGDHFIAAKKPQEFNRIVWNFLEK